MKPVTETLASRKVRYNSRPVEVSVEFSDRQQTINTLEGAVTCVPGTPILTGSEGERWPVPISEFHIRYQSVTGEPGDVDGRYIKRSREVVAAQLHEAMEITLSDGRGALKGEAGDWCVWYSDTDLAIVGGSIFPKLYASDAVSVYVELAGNLTAQDRLDAMALVGALGKALPHTPVVFTDEISQAKYPQPAWFRIVTKTVESPNIAPAPIELAIDAIQSGGEEDLALLVQKAAQRESIWAYSRNTVLSRWVKQDPKSAKESLAPVVAWHLAAIEDFNGQLVPGPEMGSAGDQSAGSAEPMGAKTLRRIEAVADGLAVQCQIRWQELVFATTTEIALTPGKSWIRFVERLSLVFLGIFAAFWLAAYSELSGKCEVNDAFGFGLCTHTAWNELTQPLFLLFYVAALAIAWCRYAKAKTQQWEIRHQDFRLLAECLRVLHVRTLLGRPSCIAADLPLAEPADSGWVPLALRSIYFNAQLAGLQTSADEPTQVNQARQSFVESQIWYHKERLLKHRERAVQRLSCWARAGIFLFGLCIGLLVLIDLLLGVAYAWTGWSPVFAKSEMAHHYILVCQVLGLACWGAMRKVMDTFGLEQELHRGRLVLSQLELAQEVGTRDAILNAANYFLDDQSRWHALHRSNPIEAATGG